MDSAIWISQKRVSAPEMIVHIMAKSFRSSFIQPTMPKTTAAGMHAIMSNPPRAVRGLPQPGLTIATRAMMAPTVHRSLKDIFPYLIVKPLQTILAVQFLYSRLCLLSVQNASYTQGIGAAFRTLKAANTGTAVWGFFRVTLIFAETVTELAVGTCVYIEFEEDQREAVKQTENCSQRTEHAAPGTNREEDGHNENQGDGQLGGIGPGDGLAQCCCLNDAGQATFQHARRTELADE